MDNTAKLIYHLPKGISWQGSKFKEYLSWYDVVLQTLLLAPLEQIEKEYSLDTCSDDILAKLFREVNTLSMFPQSLTPDDFKIILKALSLYRNWVTLTDIVELMKRLNYEFHTLDSFDVMNNPQNYPYLTWKPTTHDEAFYTIFYMLVPVTESQVQKFPVPFPILFQEEKKLILDNLLESLIDARINLVSYIN